MSKKTLFSLIATILGLSGVAQSSTSKIEVSIGGNNTEFPETSKGFLVVDTAGDGFDFAKSDTILENKSDSAAGSKWGDDDTVVLAGLGTVAFPDVGRGFNISPKDIDSSPSDKSWKSGDKLALVWFPEGSSAKGKSYSYYTSNEIVSDSGTNAFEIPEDGAVDSIVAVGSAPTEKGTVASSSSVIPPSGGGGGGSAQVQKSKKGGKGKTSSAKKAGGGTKKSSANKSSGSKKSSVKKTKGYKSKGKK